MDTYRVLSNATACKGPQADLCSVTFEGSGPVIPSTCGSTVDPKFHTGSRQQLDIAKKLQLLL